VWTRGRSPGQFEDRRAARLAEPAAMKSTTLASSFATSLEHVQTAQGASGRADGSSRSSRWTSRVRLPGYLGYWFTKRAAPDGSQEGALISLATLACIEVTAPVDRSSTWIVSSGQVGTIFPPSSLVTGRSEGS
jgi:hypothetical protein